MNKIPGSLIAANWKMHGSKALLEEMLSALLLIQDEKKEIALFPPFVYLSQAHDLLNKSQIKLGAQNLNEADQGAYTGEISASMLKECACDYVLIGHSERRHLFQETDDLIFKKVMTAQKAGLIPILCIGETEAEREKNHTFSRLSEQLSLVFQCNDINFNQIVLAYEPVWAIGTGKTATPDIAQSVHAFIREKVKEWQGKEVAENLRILYGGSVKPDNARDLLSQDDVNGALVGGASLSVQDFLKIIACCDKGK